MLQEGLADVSFGLRDRLVQCLSVSSCGAAEEKRTKLTVKTSDSIEGIILEVRRDRPSISNSTSTLS